MYVSSGHRMHFLFKSALILSSRSFAKYSPLAGINREDVLEKNVHIPIMGKVYATASSVAVWLSESDPGIEFAIHWFLEQEMKNGPIEISGDPEEEKVVNGTLSLLQHPYWTRMWTYQEFQLSKKDPVLLHGNQRLPSHALKGVIDFAKVNRSVVREAKDRKSTRLNSSHSGESRMPSSA